MNPEKKNTFIKNIFAILGFLILLIIGIWSAIQVITYIPRLFSDSGTATPDTQNGIELGNKDILARLSTDTAQSGEPIMLYWAHTGDDSGVQSFSYACKEGFYFEVAGNPVACNAPHVLDTDVRSIEITPLSAKAQVAVPLAITYTNEDSESVRDTKTLTVENTSVSDAVNTDETTTDAKETDVEGPGPIEPEETSVVPGRVTGNTTPTYTAPTTVTVRVPRTSNPYGVADLSVELISLGDINAYGAFQPKNIVHTYARGAAKFKVTNLGTKETGTWYFSAILPTRGGYPYNSEAQPSLFPGASTEIFVTFDQLIAGSHTFSVYLDPSNLIPEINEYNNTTGQILNVLSY